MTSAPRPRALPDADTLVVAALSGGVDSATAAGLLVEAGCRVVGMTMRLHDPSAGAAVASGRCCGPRDVEDARAAAAHLDIPHYVVDLAAEFARDVVADFVTSYLVGATPNPCVKCNQHIKFTPLFDRARRFGGGALVTGHYARIGPDRDLWRGVDADKDQSYFLFAMPANELAAVWFPLGGMTKPEVRAHARRLGLPNADKPESQEICFVPDGDHAGFVAREAVRRGRPVPVSASGMIVDRGGAEVGRHAGIHHFTVGQHRGLGNLATRERMFVVALDAPANRVVVGPRADAERTTVGVRDLRWLAPPRERFDAAVQLRHRGEPTPAAIAVDGTRAELALAVPRVAAPGQAAVVYAGDRVVAGGWIE